MVKKINTDESTNLVAPAMGAWNATIAIRVFLCGGCVFLVFLFFVVWRGFCCFFLLVLFGVGFCCGVLVMFGVVFMVVSREVFVDVGFGCWVCV